MKNVPMFSPAPCLILLLGVDGRAAITVLFIAQLLSSSEQSAFGELLPDDPVCCEDQDEADDGLVQADGHREARVARILESAVHVGVDDLRDRHQRAVVADDRVEHAEVAVEDAADRHQRHDADGRGQKRDRNIDDALEARGAVDVRRLVEALVNAGDRRQIDDRVVARVLPDVEDQQDRVPVARRRIEIDARTAACHDQIVEQARVRAEDALQHVADDNPGNKVREKHHGLGHLEEALRLYLIEHDGQQHSAHRTHQQEQNVDDKRVPRDCPRPARFKKVFEIRQPDERTEDSGFVIEFLKCNYNVRQGKIGKDKGVCDCRKRQQVQKLILPQLPKRVHPFLSDINQR